LLNKFIEHTQY